MPAKIPKKRRTRVTLTRTSEVLDVRMAAELLTVSPDTIYDLFKRGELPGRKEGKRRLPWLLPTIFLQQPQNSTYMLKATCKNRPFFEAR
jgi:excisionase family DNA binding protein